MTTAAEQYRALVAKLESIQQLNELAYGEEDPKNPGFMWVPADGTTPLGDGNTPKQMIGSGFGEYWNAKKVPFKKPEVTPAPAEEPAPTPAEEPVVTPVADPAPVEVTPLDPLPAPAPVQPCGPEVKEKIKAQKTFNAAYAMAKQAGCPDFDWCQIVTVPASNIEPKPSSVPAPVTTNPMGDADPTAFNGQAAAYYEEGYEYDNYILEDELNRVREIAGTQIVQELGPPKTGVAIPEIKAASKQAAIEIARKKGITQFRFCGKYKVQAAKKTRPVQPPVEPKPSVKTKQDYTISNPMGDADPTAFSGNQVR
jgi:hypothetical protein